MQYYCFTIDDNIRFLEEIAATHPASLFEHPYLAMLRRLHLRYHLCVQLNTYYSYTPDSFSLADFPSNYRQEFLNNSDWLKFSFHARHNDPAFPYDGASAEQVLRDYHDVTQNLARIMGEKSLGKTTTLHYAVATREACSALRAQGVVGLVGMFFDADRLSSLRYFLSPDEAALLRRKNFYREPTTGLLFARNHMVINTLAHSQLMPALNRLRVDSCFHGYLEVMIHEQYFYPDYEDYQPDFEKKLETVFLWMEHQKISSCFLEQLPQILNL